MIKTNRFYPIFLALGLTLSVNAAPTFERQVIDDKVLVGYGVAVGDVDGDGLEDILLADKRHFTWFQNPSWEEHVITRNITLRDNVCIAAQDIDGDGKVEVAVGARWNPGNTVEPMASGSVHYLERPNDLKQRWKPVELFHDPTVHRMRWVRGADGVYRLVVLPLHGIGNKKGAGENGVNVRVYQPDLKWIAQPRGWAHEVIDRRMHITHNFDDQNGIVYVGGVEGVVQRYITDKKERDARIITPENSGCRGVGEIRKGKDFIATIEPFHGNDLVVYRELKQADSSGKTWSRTVLTDQLKEGHALAVGDLTGDEKQEIVAGWRKPDAEGNVGLKLYTEDLEGNWQSHWIDENQMATEDVKIADLDRDGKLDIIASGRATNNLVIYWNRSE